MRDLFPGYYPPTQTKLVDLWSSALVVLDANVLLDFYRLKDSVVDELFAVLEKFGERVWVPNEAAFEYHRNIDNVIAQQAKACRAAKGALDGGLKQLENALNHQRSHPFSLPGAVVDELRSAIHSAGEDLSRQESELLKLENGNPLKVRIADFFEGKVGPPFPQDELANILKEGEKRAQKEIPPGFKDYVQKKEADLRTRLGDFTLWRQTVEHASKVDMGVILVTNDTKSDWVTRLEGRAAPLPALVEEFVAVNARGFLLYDTRRFLAEAQARLDTEVTEEALADVDGAKSSRVALRGFTTAEDARATLRALTADDSLSALRALTADDSLSALRALSRDDSLSALRALSRDDSLSALRAWSRDDSLSALRALTADDSLSALRAWSADDSLSALRALTADDWLSSVQSIARAPTDEATEVLRREETDAAPDEHDVSETAAPDEAPEPDDEC